MFTLEEKSREWERRHPQYTSKATPEDEKRYREMELFDAESLVKMVDEMQEAAMVELEQFGNIEFEPQFNWHAKSTPDDRGWSRAVIDIIAFEGEDAEPLFELF